ncbi:hypothetical protein HGRIS_003177 [Hohenbuehelia grisea]|uniref:Uncharacterized protein n=1 Tax=Hohenbuehelia grisea TaxID=104357 RepID=A0ABR3JNF4_9AGAR
MLHFADKIKGNRRGFIQEFIEQKVDRDTDFYTCTVSENPANYVLMREDWHRSENDKEEHLTGDVYYVSQGLVGLVLGLEVLMRLETNRITSSLVSLMLLGRGRLR